MTYPVRYGGDSGNRIFVLYWRCPLLEVPLYNSCLPPVNVTFQLLFSSRLPEESDFLGCDPVLLCVSKECSASIFKG